MCFGSSDPVLGFEAFEPRSPKKGGRPTKLSKNVKARENMTNGQIERARLRWRVRPLELVSSSGWALELAAHSSLAQSRRWRETAAQAHPVAATGSKWLREPALERRILGMSARESAEAADYSRN